MDAELVLDTPRTETPLAPMDHTFGKPLGRKEAATLQVVEHMVELLGRLGIRPELAEKFEPAVLTLRQQAQCPSGQGWASRGSHG
jgi:hypothetical protein